MLNVLVYVINYLLMLIPYVVDVVGAILPCLRFSVLRLQLHFLPKEQKKNKKKLWKLFLLVSDISEKSAFLLVFFLMRFYGSSTQALLGNHLGFCCIILLELEASKSSLSPSAVSVTV